MLACVSLENCLAQEEDKIYLNDVFVTTEYNVPMFDNVGTNAVFGLHYGHSYYNGLGFRAGVQYSPSVAHIKNVIGTPLAFTYRTHSRNRAARIYNGVNSAVESMSRNWYYDNSHLGDGLLGFLAGLYDRVEFYAGVTPGYIFGENSLPSENRASGTTRWVEKEGAFSLTLDAGMNLNFQIWCFDLKLMPAFHYNVLGNYVLHSNTEDLLNGQTTKQTNVLRWFFTIGGGLAFHF